MGIVGAEVKPISLVGSGEGRGAAEWWGSGEGGGAAEWWGTETWKLAESEHLECLEINSQFPKGWGYKG